MQFEVSNRFSGRVQFTAQIECAEDAPLSIKLGLAVQWARLSGTDLSGARISHLAALGFPDGWSAYTYVTKNGEQRIRVGCRNMTLAEGRVYWANKSDRREVLAVLDYAEAIARIRGWGDPSKKEAAV